ncbi:Chemotaxis protein methyltransferase CheR [Collimonas arenae]|uniref:Chemotaxis protein methyltransferase CheR n=1 Tax=Collimonas arenae TaxID=279058 RepID=A0A0A1FCN1_9BURK|nr:CheR family methyltransferase [Collimonas arenae]AIY41434.1 Chemotaxis protein methyltransferase CheR [Collimonas arenae]
MPLAKFEIMLKRTMGLDIQSIGRPMLERALQERQNHCGVDDLDAYWLLLQMSEPEQLQLIESVIVPETWFFRNREAFQEMVQLQQRWPRLISGSQPLRILSLPCSTGEEPYSIAMALLDAGMPPQHFQIDAIDISPQSLNVARQAVYGKNSFRGDFLSFRDRYFALNEQGYALSETVRQQVRFTHSNLFAYDLLTGQAPYDIIFCRNLLIYFDRPTQHTAVTLLTQRLAPEGLMFVGPAESALMMQHELTPIKAPMAFAFRKGVPKKDIVKAAASPAAAYTPLTLTPTPRRRSVPNQGLSRAAQSKATPAGGATESVSQGNLAKIQLLADQGKLEHAAVLCEQHIKQHGASAAAYYLMGVIHDAADRKQAAADCYRKALYLEPMHANAMTHLAALLQTQGDLAGARLLQQRARRSTENNQP